MKILSLVLLVLRAGASSNAPADQYFGQLKVSALRIRYEIMQLRPRYETHKLLPEEAAHLLVLDENASMRGHPPIRRTRGLPRRAI